MSLANERSTVLLAKEPYALTAQKRTRCRIILSSVLSVQTNMYITCARSWPKSAQGQQGLSWLRPHWSWIEKGLPRTLSALSQLQQASGHSAVACYLSFCSLGGESVRGGDGHGARTLERWNDAERNRSGGKLKSNGVWIMDESAEPDGDVFQNARRYQSSDSQQKKEY